MLEPWIQTNLVTYMQMTYVVDGRYHNWQLKAYRHCFNTFSTRHNWMGVIDSSKFIYVSSLHHAHLYDLLVHEFDAYSGLVMNYVMYGSSGLSLDPTVRFPLTTTVHASCHMRHTGTMQHSYTNRIPLDAIVGHTHREVKAIMHMAYGQNMVEYRSTAHRGYSMVWTAR